MEKRSVIDSVRDYFGDGFVTQGKILTAAGELLQAQVFLVAFGCLRKRVLVKKHYANVTLVDLMSFMCEFLYLSEEATGV